MKYIYLILVSSLFFSTAFSQVGIGTTTTPTDTLEVNGNIKLSGKLYLEKPGGFPVINNQKFLVKLSTNAYEKLDINTAKYGPINHVTYKFNDIAKEGLKGFDTKIPTNKYLLAIHGYKFDNPSVHFKSSNGDKYEGFVFNAYKDTTTHTWKIDFYCNKSKFYDDLTIPTSPQFVYANLSLEVFIYRKNLLASDSGNVITIDMNNHTTATAPKPTGY